MPLIFMCVSSAHNNFCKKHATQVPCIFFFLINGTLMCVPANNRLHQNRMMVVVMMRMLMLKSLFKSKYLLLVPPFVLHIDFGSLLLSATLNVANSYVCVTQTFGHIYLILVHPNYPGSFCSLWMYRVIHKSLRDFRTRLHNNQDRHGRKEHINR